jgi:hypothetical protein
MSALFKFLRRSKVKKRICNRMIGFGGGLHAAVVQWSWRNELLLQLWLLLLSSQPDPSSEEEEEEEEKEEVCLLLLFIYTGP